MTATDVTFAGLMDAIRATPDDDTPRLILADWLEDNGQEARAEFIRVQIAIDRLNAELVDDTDCGSSGCDGCRERRELQVRECELLLASSWWDTLPFPSYAEYQSAAMKKHTHARLFTRGFVSAVRCPLALWMAHGKAILAEYPVTRVEASDRTPQKYPMYEPGHAHGWRRGTNASLGADTHGVPDVVWEWMRENRKDIDAELHGSWIDFASHEAAVAGLSRALIAVVK